MDGLRGGQVGPYPRHTPTAVSCLLLPASAAWLLSPKLRSKFQILKSFEGRRAHEPECAGHLKGFENGDFRM